MVEKQFQIVTNMNSKSEDIFTSAGIKPGESVD